MKKIKRNKSSTKLILLIEHVVSQRNTQQVSHRNKHEVCHRTIQNDLLLHPYTLFISILSASLVGIYVWSLIKVTKPGHGTISGLHLIYWFIPTFLVLFSSRMLLSVMYLWPNLHYTTTIQNRRTLQRNLHE